MSAAKRLRVVHATLSPAVSAPVEASRMVTYLQTQDVRRDGYCAEMYWDPQLRMLLVGDVGYPGATRLVFAPGEVRPVGKTLRDVFEAEEVRTPEEPTRNVAAAWSATEPEFPDEETPAAAGEEDHAILKVAPAPSAPDKRGKPKRSWQSKLAGMAGGGNGAGS